MIRTAFGAIRPNLRTLAPEGESGGSEPAEGGTPAPEAGTPAADAPATPAGEPQDVASLPAWAQKIITDTRAEAAKHRTEKATAAETATKALADKIAVAAGLKPETAADPAALTQQLTTAQKAARDAAVQLAVFRAASKAQANPDALLDSNTFLATVNGLDPTSSDFPTHVTDAIKRAVDANPTAFRIAQAAGASAADHAGGSGEAGAITEQQVASASPEQVDAWLRAGRLNHLL